MKKEGDHSTLIGGHVSQLPDAHRRQYYGTGFCEKKKLYCKVGWQGDRKQGSYLSSFYKSGEDSWYAGVLAVQVLTGRLWNMAIYGKVWENGFSSTTSWTMDPSFLKGSRRSGSGVQLPVMPWFFGSVGGGSLVPGVEVKIFSCAHASAV